MDIKKFSESKSVLKIVLIVLGILIVFLFVFKVGESVGIRKASFSCGWAQNYQRNFGGPRGGFMGDFMGRDRELMNSHGMAGSIIKIDGNTLVVKGADNVEKIVLVTDRTMIRRNIETLKISDLKVDDQIVFIGRPDDQGQIQADLIRVFN